jgi:hypothetical protein
MAEIDLSAAGRIQIEPARDTIRMWPGVGGARLELQMTAMRRDERKDAPVCQLAAAMTVGRMVHTDQRFVCDVKALHPISPATFPTPVVLKGFITDHQLRVIEAIRRGGSLAIGLDITASCVDGEPGRLLSGSANESFNLQSGEWSSALERADAGSYVELLVPLPANQEHATAVRRLRKARELMRDDQVEQALGETRKAVESVRAACQTRKLAAIAEKKDLRQRTKDERWALYVEDIFSLLSGAVHDDADVTEHFTWTRAEADTLIVSTAGMLAQLAETRT